MTGKDCKKIIKLCDDLANRFEERNLFAHNMVLNTDDPKVIQIQSLKATSKGVPRDPAPYTAKTILALATEMRRLTVEIDQALTALGFPPLPPDEE